MLSSETLFSNLTADIYDVYSPHDCTDTHHEEFNTILNNGSAVDMLAWLLAIKPEDVPEYIEQAANDKRHEADLPTWMLRFKPSYSLYSKRVQELTETAPIKELVSAVVGSDDEDDELELVPELLTVETSDDSI